MTNDVILVSPTVKIGFRSGLTFNWIYSMRFEMLDFDMWTWDLYLELDNVSYLINKRGRE